MSTAAKAGSIGVVGALVAAVVLQLPEFRRYLRIRSM